jgi:hypothetical protein
VTRRFKNVYDLDEADDGTFDLVFCASVLLHLTDPLRAMAAPGATREVAIARPRIRSRGRAARARSSGAGRPRRLLGA